MRVCAIIAAYNEGPNIAAVIAGVKAVLKPGDEVLVVDDGSVDDTSEAARGAGARVVRQEPNQGKGKAIQRGLKEATGDVVLFIDGDGQDYPSEIPLLLAELDRGADFVNGSKFIGTMKEGAISTPNYFGNKFMSGLINILFGVHITDSQAGYRAIRLDKVRAIPLTAKEYEIETEMLIKSIKRGLKIVEVPVTRDRRAAGRTNFKRIRNGLIILGTILKLRFTAA
ncbi:MAG: glycosyltransferase family 2 protein [Acidobacteria bacterium]|nr:glycosyltransferase family 2 protein [Acidobacteriota bacterium]